MYLLSVVCQVINCQSKPFRILTLPDWLPASRGWFSDAMSDLGWAEGRDFIVVQSGFRGYQFSERQLDEAARRFVADKPDLIITITTAWALAAHRATATIPIVMYTSGYPVESGLADSLARPGKNVTGNSIYAGTEVWGKLLQLLYEAKPGVKRISVLWAYVPPAFAREEIEPCYVELRTAARSLDLKLHIVEVATADQVPAALAEIEAERPDALLLAGRFALNVMSSITQFAVNSRLPTIVDSSLSAFMVEPSPLLSYGPVFRELMRSAAASVDKILKGAKPGDLPIQQPAKFELEIDAKTAKAIELTIPQSLLLRADRLIE